MGGEGNPPWVAQKTEIRLFKKSGTCTTQNPQREWDTQHYLGFWDSNGSPNLSQTTRTSDRHQKKHSNEQRESAEFVVWTDTCVKMNESEKRYKFIGLTRGKTTKKKKTKKKQTMEEWY